MDSEYIENVLISMGMPRAAKGFPYIVDAVILLNTPEWSNPKWYALYYCIGNKYNISASLVEASIRNAFKSVRNKCVNYEKINHYIGFANCENSNSLMLLSSTIKYETEKTTRDITKLMIKECLMELLSC